MERDASWPGGSEYDGDWQCDRREGFGRQKDDDGGDSSCYCYSNTVLSNLSYLN
jgi:hypothetical protein